MTTKKRPKKQIHESTALHEAGHAVAQVRFNIDQHAVTIIPDKDRGSRGSVTAEGEESVWSATQAALMIEALCAGYAALIAAGYSEDDAVRGCEGSDSSDFAKAEHLLNFWRVEGDLATWKARAVERMTSLENQRAVRLVADHLLRYKTLSWEYVANLVELADGSMTQQEFDDWPFADKNRGEHVYNL